MDVSFYYTQDPDSNEPIMLINNYIGYDDNLGPGIMGDQFMRELMALDELGKKRIQIWINSPGGSVSDGYSIYGTMMKTKTPIDTYCLGMAASIAGVIFQGGRKRTMLDFSWLMYHNAYNESGKIDNGLATICESIAIMIANKSGKNVDEIKKIMNRQTYILAEEALSSGFCDAIEDSAVLNAQYKPSIPKNMYELARVKDIESQKYFFLTANKVINSIFKPNTMTDLKRINNKLGLNQDASEDSTLDALNAIVNKAAKAEDDKKKSEEDCTKAEEDKKALKDKIAKMEDDKKKSEEDLKALKDKLAKMEDDKKEEDDKRAKAEEDDKKDKAKNLIEGYVMQNILPNDPKMLENWKAKAFIDFDGIKALIESMPLNKKAPRLPQTLNGQGKPLEGSQAAIFMAQTRNKLQGIK